MYWIDINGGDTGDAVETYCDMDYDGGGWTACYGFENTDAVDIDCNDGTWAHPCVDFTMSPETGTELMIHLEDGMGKRYQANGNRNGDWNYTNLTSTNGSGSQYQRNSQHSRPVTLNDGRFLTISGFDGSNAGWGGSWGNGYVIVVNTGDCYACDVVLSAMSHRHSSPEYSRCEERSFSGFTPAHEVMFDAAGNITTNGGATLPADKAYRGTFRFLVR